MVEAMNSVAKLGVELNAEERNLLSVGYKNMLKRASWSDTQHAAALAKEYLERVEDELTTKCNEILLTIDDYLLPSSKSGEAAVFYHKMKGDYYRYSAEIKSDADREEAKSQSLKAYEDATAIAQSDLLPTHPISLGLALNFSMFYYEIMADTERACNMAKQAFEDAAAELDSLDENSYQDSSLIMRLIMDNLTLWTADPSEDEDMVEAMNSVAKLGVELNAEERNLLSVGYKNMLKRASWSDTQHAAALAKEYLERVEDELTTKCNEILLTIDDTLIIRLMGDKSNAEASDTKREKGDKHQVSGFLKLPDDSIYALMGRLEVTDIVRLGGVSKYLSKFGKEYIKSRLRTNIFLPSSQFHSLSITEDHSWMCHDIQRVSNTPRDPAVFPYRSFPENLIVGSIEGTLLIVELKLAPHTLLLVNPLTKHQIVIPPRPAQPHPLLLIEDDAVINMFAYGLGWARKPSEIAVYQLFRMFSIGMEPCCALYSVKEGYWIKFPPLDGSIEITQYAGTLHMGTNSLYWLAKDDRTREVVILKLNMEQLLFSTLPFSTEARGVPVDCLGIVNGNLSALTREYMESDSVPCSEVWALEEGGESRRNWSRIYTIPHHQLFNSRRSYFPTILTFTDGGLVFLLNLEKTDSKEEEQKRYITVYNLPDNSLQELSSPTTMRYVSATQASVYTESTRFPDHIRNTMKSDEEQTAAEEVLKDLNKPPMYVVEMTGLGADDW